ncbi:MAG: hypothetical protein GTN78_01815, partial [Gemmatimonadales bacterium]|nr:hypothetical protein [Gemmatimonadales bacterium]
MRLALVTNPRSGRGRGIAAARVAERVFTAAGWDAVTMLTEHPGHEAELARHAVDEGFHAVAACGGDGTLSQVLTGLLDTGIPVGAIPAGTGNDFARTIGMSRDPGLAAQQIVEGRPAQVDLLEINRGMSWSVNVIGLGFDAAVALRINRRRRLTGGVVAYLTAVAQELLRYRPTHIRLQVDDEKWEGRALLLAVA